VSQAEDSAPPRPHPDRPAQRHVEGPEQLLWITDRDLVVLWLNPAAARFLGRAPAACIGRSVCLWLPEQVRREAERGVQLALDPHAPTGLALGGLLRNEQGRELDVEWCLHPLFGPQGAVQGFAVSARDLADRRDVEAQLVRSQNRLQAVVEAMLDPLISIDDHGTVQAANPSVERVLGWPPAELIGRNINVLMPEPHHTAHDGYLAHYRATGRTWILGQTRDFEVRRKDGELILCSLSVSRAELSDGQPVFTGTFRDVTEKRRAERELRDSELRFRGLFENSYEYLGLLTPDGRVLEANRTALEGAGLVREDVIGLYFWDTKWWSSDPELRERVKSAVATAARGEFVRFEARLAGRGGRVLEIDFSLKPLRDEQGRVLMLLPEGRDIGEIKRAQRAETGVLRALATVGESAALLAHEIKNPITAVNLALRAVADQLGEDQQEVLGELATRMQRMEQMLRRTLSFARPLELKRVRLEPRAFVEACLARLASQVARRGARVELRAPHELPPLLADEQLLEEVLANLVTNALEAQEGAASVVVSLAAAGRELVLAVDDDGPGIPDSVRATLFRPFVTSKPQGNGFGLALSRKVVEEHGGTIQAGPSALGGARFEIRLPVTS